MIRNMKIPEDRVAVFIGKDGTTKMDIEEKTHTKIEINEEIIIKGEAIDVMAAENIVKAIGRGFSPKNAFQLLDENVTLDMIDLPKNERLLRRIRSRLIGIKGKCRRNLELLTKTKISIYGRTVGIIGRYKNVELAEDAINRLIKGFSHRSVYEYLEHHQNDVEKE